MNIIMSLIFSKTTSLSAVEETRFSINYGPIKKQKMAYNWFSDKKTMSLRQTFWFIIDPSSSLYYQILSKNLKIFKNIMARIWCSKKISSWSAWYLSYIFRVWFPKISIFRSIFSIWRFISLISRKLYDLIIGLIWNRSE